MKHSKIHCFIKSLKNWRVVFQCWKLIWISRISARYVTTWTYREFLIVSQTINYKKRLYIEIFNKINVKINTFDIDDCHCMGESKKTTIVCFIIRKNCKAVLEISWVNRYLDNDKLVFQSDARIYVSKNLTPYNHHLAWKCRELKRAGKIHSCWSAKGVVKIRKTMNKHPIAITHDTDIASLYPDFVFWERTRSRWVDFQRENKFRVSWSGCCFAFHSHTNND